MKLAWVRFKEAVQGPVNGRTPMFHYRSATADDIKALTNPNLFEVTTEGPWVTIRNIESRRAVMSPMVNVIDAEPMPEAQQQAAKK